jgi:hypothetical protein
MIEYFGKRNKESILLRGRMPCVVIGANSRRRSG